MGARNDEWIEDGWLLALSILLIADCPVGRAPRGPGGWAIRHLATVSDQVNPMAV